VILEAALLAWGGMKIVRKLDERGTRKALSGSTEPKRTSETDAIVALQFKHHHQELAAAIRAGAAAVQASQLRQAAQHIVAAYHELRGLRVAHAAFTDAGRTRRAKLVEGDTRAYVSLVAAWRARLAPPAAPAAPAAPVKPVLQGLDGGKAAGASIIT